MSFPLNSNQAYVKDTGERSTLGKVISGSNYQLPVATDSKLGGVKVGSGLSITEEGTLSVSGGGGGSHVYLHQLLLTHSGNTNRKIALGFYTPTSTAITKDDLFDLLYNDGTPRTIYGMNAGSSVSYGLTANMDGETKRFAFIDSTGSTNLAIASTLFEEIVIQF